MAAHNNLKAFQDSAVKNDLTALSWLNRLVELNLCAFKWENVPDSVDVRYLEKTLCEKAAAVWFQDEVTGELLALQGVTDGSFDVYGNPMLRRGIGYNGYNVQLDYTNSVIMWNNYQRVPSFPVLLNYARILADLDRTIEVNVNNQKTPKIIRCTKDQYLTFKNLQLKSDGNQNWIFMDNDLNPDALSVFDMTVPFVADKLYDIKNRIWADALGFIGIPANSIEKAERVNLLELELSNASTEAQRYTKLISRQEAVKQINERFGTNIKVSFRFEQEVDQDGRIHDAAQTDTAELPSPAQAE